MRTKLDCILLIDDDEPTNFLNVMIVNETECTQQVVALESAQEGLDYLHRIRSENKPNPDLIFLDINMPGLNGWEFLEQCQQEVDFGEEKPVIVMLTTSLNPDDEQRAKQINLIDDYLTKPLTKEMLDNVITRHFDMVTQ